MKLSPTMHHAIVYARKHGGKMVRYPGGFWCKDGIPGWTRGTTNFGTATIEALVNRGVAEYTQWKEGRSGKFPIEVTMKKSD